MTSPYTAFDLAIKTKGVYLAETALAELPRIGHEHRAALVLLYAEKDPDKYERAGKRWIGRLLEDPRCRLTLADVREMAMALETLPMYDSARDTLAEILQRAGERAAARVFAPAVRDP